MPGVLIDDQNYPLDNSSPSSFFESLGSYSPTAMSHAQQQQQQDHLHHHQQQQHAMHQQQHQQPHHQLMRHNSFSGGTKDSSSGASGVSLSHAAPVYQRSQSALSSAAAFHALNFFNSPPTTPRKSSNSAGFSSLSLMDVGDDFSSLRAGDGDGSLVGGGLSVSPGAAVAMAISGVNTVTGGDLRSLAFGNSAIVGSPTLPDSVAALHKYLPSNNEDEEAWGGSVVDVYACDQFRMFEFKVRRCMRGRSHDWTECPFAHPGEKARRRDPRRFHYSGTACPDFRKGSCRRGDACEFAHGVFECWLHPARYRTQPCKDGRNCRRRVCFFAHTTEQLRLLPAAAAANASPRGGGGGLGASGQASALSGAGSLSGSYDGSPVRSCSSSFDGAYGFDGATHCSLNSPLGSCQNTMNYGGAAASAVCGHFENTYSGNVGAHSAHCCASPQMSSPTSTLLGHSTSPPPLSPPMSPGGSPPMSPQSPQHWPSSQSLHRNAGAFSPGTQASLVQSSGPYGQSLTQTGFSQGPCSPLSRPTNGGQSVVSAAVAAAAAVHAQQHGQPMTPAHRRHLDRLSSMPALAIPPVDHPSHRSVMQSVSSPLSTPSSCSPPSPDGLNSSSNLMMSDLIATIEQLGIRGSAIPLWLQGQAAPGQSAANVYSSGPSPLRRCSQSVPCTPTKQGWEEKSPAAWETVAESDEAEPAVQRVESGRDLRAKIYGRIGKENRQDSGDAPDLGWVSELVKDEQAW